MIKTDKLLMKGQSISLTCIQVVPSLALYDNETIYVSPIFPLAMDLLAHTFAGCTPRSLKKKVHPVRVPTRYHDLNCYTLKMERWIIQKISESQEQDNGDCLGLPAPLEILWLENINRLLRCERNEQKWWEETLHNTEIII